MAAQLLAIRLAQCKWCVDHSKTAAVVSGNACSLGPVVHVCGWLCGLAMHDLHTCDLLAGPLVPRRCLSSGTYWKNTVVTHSRALQDYLLEER